MGFFNGWGERALNGFSKIGKQFSNAVGHLQNMTKADSFAEGVSELLSAGEDLSIGTMSGIVQVATLGSMGGSFNEGLNRVNNTSKQAQSLIAQGDVSGGLQRGFVGLVDSLTTTLTLGGSTDIGKALDSYNESRASGETKGNFLLNIIGDTYQTGKDFNDNIYQAQVEALEAGDVKSACKLGRTAMIQTALQTVEVAGTAAFFVPVPGARGVAFALKGASMAAAAAGVGSNYYMQKFNDGVARVDEEDAIAGVLQDFKDLGYEFDEKQIEDFNRYTKGFAEGTLDEEQWMFMLENGGVLVQNDKTYETAYKEYFQEYLDSGVLNQSQYDALVDKSVDFSMGRITQEDYDQISQTIMLSDEYYPEDEDFESEVEQYVPDREDMSLVGKIASGVSAAASNVINTAQQAVEDTAEHENEDYGMSMA